MKSLIPVCLGLRKSWIISVSSQSHKKVWQRKKKNFFKFCRNTYFLTDFFFSVPLSFFTDVHSLWNNNSCSFCSDVFEDRTEIITFKDRLVFFFVNIRPGGGGEDIWTFLKKKSLLNIKINFFWRIKLISIFRSGFGWAGKLVPLSLRGRRFLIRPRARVYLGTWKPPGWPPWAAESQCRKEKRSNQTWSFFFLSPSVIFLLYSLQQTNSATCVFTQ